ncbi:hypothetical protein [uncultured Tateyamaria sp.]|uniref:hypothetical protein n=1 Tax=uncultured Tateyamaria sp. TaxID=455651 RepID=UPI00261E8D5C|nr:hypothetical protein [uncultured Tateyamaria sp.]
MAQTPKRQITRWHMAAIKGPLRRAYATGAPDCTVPRRLGALLDALRDTPGAATRP